VRPHLDRFLAHLTRTGSTGQKQDKGVMVVPVVDDPLGRYEGDPWEQQPGETALQYARFLEYAGARPGERSLSDVARNHNVDTSTIWEVAKRGRWRERAALRDADDHKRRRDAITAKETELAERSMNVALVAVGIIARALRKITEAEVILDAKDLPHWARMVETMRRIAIDAPDQVVAITGPGGGPIRIAEFDGLTPEQIRDRSGEMARSVLRTINGGKAS
jgi:hypothetical protein